MIQFNSVIIFLSEASNGPRRGNWEPLVFVIAVNVLIFVILIIMIIKIMITVMPKTIVILMISEMVIMKVKS